MSRILAAAALAADPGKAAATPALAKADDDPLVCTIEKGVGTSLRTKVCRRQSDVDDTRLRAQDRIRRIQQVQTVK
jgi:hypothetical protein